MRGWVGGKHQGLRYTFLLWSKSVIDLPFRPDVEVDVSNMRTMFPQWEYCNSLVCYFDGRKSDMLLGVTRGWIEVLG